MRGFDETAGGRGIWAGLGLIAVLAWMLLAGDAARADCNPQAASNVSGTCTGTTTNQQLNPPGTSVGTEGYGGSSVINLNVTVVPGATVTGTNNGLRANGGTVSNAGTVTGNGAGGVEYTTTLVLTNTGTITGAVNGVLATTATVTNSGLITGASGVTTNGTDNLTNSGVISGTVSAIKSIGTATIFNSGTMTGGTGDSISGVGADRERRL